MNVTRLTMFEAASINSNLSSYVSKLVAKGAIPHVANGFVQISLRDVIKYGHH